MDKIVNCILFDGSNLSNNKKIIIEDGIVKSIEDSGSEECSKFFVMPCLIDAHTHMGNMTQVKKMSSYGISTTFDVSATPSLINKSNKLNIISSISMAMLFMFDAKKFVENSVKYGAKYIKVLLFNSFSFGQCALKKIVKEAHKKNLKVVVHATKLSTYKQAIKCGVDIILHLPMKQKLTNDLAKTIAKKNISVVPTLCMMQAFAISKKMGYAPQHFANALKQVETLYKNGVRILAGTDANSGYFAPAISYGDSLYKEIELLLKANLPLIEVLKGATHNIGNAFDMNDLGVIKPNKPASLLIFDVEDNISVNYNKLSEIWINGEQIKKFNEEM